MENGQRKVCLHSVACPEVNEMQNVIATKLCSISALSTGPFHLPSVLACEDNNYVYTDINIQESHVNLYT